MIRLLNRAPHSGWVAFYEVASHSNPEKTYIVAQKEDGSYGCGCPAWTFQRKHGGECKHISDLRHWLAQAEKIGTPIETVEPSAKTIALIEKKFSRAALIEA